MANDITLGQLQNSLHDLLTEMVSDVPQQLTDDILTFEKLAIELEAAGKNHAETTVRRLVEHYEKDGRIMFAGWFANERGRRVRGWRLAR